MKFGNLLSRTDANDLARLKTENEKLRAALQSIADQCDDCEAGFLIRIAERALENAT